MNKEDRKITIRINRKLQERNCTYEDLCLILQKQVYRKDKIIKKHKEIIKYLNKHGCKSEKVRLIEKIL